MPDLTTLRAGDASILSDKRMTERLYKYNPAGYCGVIMPEKVMKKLAKLTNDFQAEVRKVLTDNIDDLYCYDWGLAYPKGEQTPVFFAHDGDFGASVLDRIKLFKAMQPEYLPEVYYGHAHDEDGKAIIKAIEEQSEGGQS